MINKHISLSHFGVYGIVLNSSRTKVLVVNKAKGPYVGKFDLPGGGFEEDELIEDTLRREFFEEVGVEIKNFWQLRSFDYICECDYWIDPSEERKCWFRHIGLIYEVEIMTDDVKLTPDGNDSLGCEWVDQKDISRKNSSYMLYEAVQLIKRNMRNKFDNKKYIRETSTVSCNKDI